MIRCSSRTRARRLLRCRGRDVGRQNSTSGSAVNAQSSLRIRRTERAAMNGEERPENISLRPRSARTGRTRILRCADHRRDESTGSSQTVNTASQTGFITWRSAATVSAVVPSSSAKCLEEFRRKDWSHATAGGARHCSGRPNPSRGSAHSAIQRHSTWSSASGSCSINARMRGAEIAWQIGQLEQS